MNERIAGLLRQDILRTEVAAAHGAAAMLSKAREFLAAARKQVDESPSVAFDNAYTAGRQAVTALMWSMELRVAERADSHQTVAKFAEAALTATRELDPTELDRLRRKRNGIEYDARPLATPGEARAACAFVERLVATIELRLLKSP